MRETPDTPHPSASVTQKTAAAPPSDRPRASRPGRVRQVNGVTTRTDAEPGERLLDVLRERLATTGPKRGCGRGECGACTVLLAGEPVLSCLVPWSRATEVETIEGLVEESGKLRAAFADAGAFQCGFCTPGQLVRAVALLRRSDQLTDDEIRQAMGGNICRCTGYAGIVRAIRRVLDERAAR